MRHGGLGLRQLGVAATHCNLESKVANFMKVLCSQEIYRYKVLPSLLPAHSVSNECFESCLNSRNRYAMMEMGLDPPDLPMGMLSNVHLRRCEHFLLLAASFASIRSRTHVCE